MATPKQPRQGDVLLIKLDKTLDLDTKKAQEVPKEMGFTVLAHGEVTGHSHKIVGADALLYEVDGERFLRVKKDTQLQHEEHGAIPLDAGDYKVVRQREYTPQETRFVRD